MRKNNWIQKANNPKKKGALHRQLGIPQDKTIPKKTLRDITKTDIGKKSHGHTVTTKLKQRAVFALNAQQRRKTK
jgi:hypothetical protein